MTPESKPFFAAAGLMAVVAFGLNFTTLGGYAIVPVLLAILLAAFAILRVDNRMGIIASSAVGMGLAGYLYLQKVGEASGRSVCDLNATFNCGTVNSSEYSELAGIPVSLLGATFYLALILIGLGVNKSDNDARQSFAQLTFLLSIPANVMSLYLAWASLQLGAFCIFCIGMYVVNILLLWAGLRGRGDNRSLSMKNAAVFALSFAVLTFFGMDHYRKNTAAPVIEQVAKDSTSLGMYYQTLPTSLRYTGDEPVLGDPNAPYVIVEFADFGCPHCKQAASDLKNFVAQNKDVQVRYKYFPLSGACNPGLPDQGRSEVCNAAFAAHCAHTQGQFWEMSDKLFTNQGYFGMDQIRFMAEQLGLDMAAFDTCMADEATLKVVQDNAQAGIDVGIEGTPTMFMRGVKGREFVKLTRHTHSAGVLVEAGRNGITVD